MKLTSPFITHSTALACSELKIPLSTHSNSTPNLRSIPHPLRHHHKMTTTASQQTLQTLPIDLLPSVDITTLSQSQLLSLSLSSHSHLHSNDVVSPSIDRSTFNESAGSRRQTYSRSSSSASSHHRHHHHRLSSLLPNPNHNPVPNPNDEADRAENRSILGFLKELLAAHPDFQELGYLDFDIFNNFSSGGFGILSNEGVNSSYLQEFPVAARKRKRGRKPKVKGLGAAGMGLEIVNRNGVAVNIVELAQLEDPYKEELRRRTAGMVKEEELLGFFSGLGGQWCSRRRKRKIVDASDFGDFLPVDWKLLLGIKRKEGRAWAYCRRYISPGGIQFLYCKDAAAYLQSFFGPYEGQPIKDPQSTHMHCDGGASENFAVAVEVEEDGRQANELQKEMSLLEFGCLTEVEIRDLFECHKCNMNFDEKDAYLQHLLSFHHGTTRRHRLGSSIGDGGQIDVQKSSDSPSKDEFPTRISKMDALVEIAQNSILETSGNSDDCNGGFISERVNQISMGKLSASTSEHELLDSESPLSKLEMEDEMIENPVGMVFYPHDSDYAIFHTKIERVDDAGVRKMSSSGNAQCHGLSITIGGEGTTESADDRIEQSIISQRISPENHSLTSLNDKNNEADNNVSAVASEEFLLQSKPEELDNVQKDIEIKIGFRAKVPVVQNNLQESFEQSINHVNQHNVSEQHISALQSHDCPSSSTVLNEEEKPSCCSIDQSHVKPDGFGEPRSEELEQLKFSFGITQESLSHPVIAAESVDITQMEEVVCGAQFDAQVSLSTTDGSELVTICIWCGVEFRYEALDTEIQSDSVGYMCPTCKAKIS